LATKSHDEVKKEKILELSNAIADEDDCHVMVFNFGLEPGFSEAFYRFICKRKTKRKNLLLFLTTEGGSPGCAYRIARRLQEVYGARGTKGTITIAVAGWCKSAGTLLCIAADKLIIADTGELDPLDVQIDKSDEIWGERSSGLVVEAAFEKLQQESFKLFFRTYSGTP
jgi:Serine dehydrogenase proteinase